jgi:amidase
MKPRFVPSPWIVPGLLLLTLSFSGCSLLPKLPDGRARPKDHTYIAYWPPAENITPAPLRLAVKDNIDMKGYVTSAGSEYLFKNRGPAVRDADCLTIVRQRPNVAIVGKTNLSEFAISPSGINDYFGTPRNPFGGFRRLIPGGSSCGSAAAVAGNTADIAFGTDTAGSVRVPAACCGVVGLKTTFGLVSLDGVFPIDAQHLDTIGPLARDIAGTVQGMDLLQNGFASKYAAAVAARPSAQTIRVGRLRLSGTHRKIDKAVDQALEKAGFQVVPLDASFAAKWEQAKKDGTTVAQAATWLSDAKYLNKAGVTSRSKSIILLGAAVYTTQYKQALSRRDDWQRALGEVFKQVDFIALPTLQNVPPKISPTLKVDLLKAQARVDNWQNTDLLNFTDSLIAPFASIPVTSLQLIGIDLLEAQMMNLQNTVAVNFAGNPALAVPIPLHGSRVPKTSLQLIGPNNSEADLLAIGRLVEASQQGN